VVSNSFHCRAVGPHPTAPIYTDFRRKHRPKSVLAKPQRFVTDFDAAFVRQVFDIPERKQKTDLEHYGQADDLKASLRILKGRGSGHATRVGRGIACSQPGFF